MTINIFTWQSCLQISKWWTDMATSGEVQFQILKLENKFQQACSQIQILNSLVQQLEVRYSRAATRNLKSHGYMLHMRLTSVEEMLSLYQECATMTAEKIEVLSKKLQEAQPEPLILYDSDSEWDWVMRFQTTNGSFQSHQILPKEKITPWAPFSF